MLKHYHIYNPDDWNNHENQFSVAYSNGDGVRLFPYEDMPTEFYLIHSSFFIPVRVKSVSVYNKYSWDWVLFNYNYKQRTELSALLTQNVHVHLYYDTGEICSTCLSLMRDFDECAPVIETKIGTLIL